MDGYADRQVDRLVADDAFLAQLHDEGAWEDDRVDRIDWRICQATTSYITADVALEISVGESSTP